MHAPRLVTTLCPDEIMAASGAPFPVTLVTDPALRPFVEAATATWNAALHRTQFVLSP